MGTAIFVKHLTENFSGDARLYKVDPPVEYSVYNFDAEMCDYESITDHVIVSGIDSGWACETYIFPATSSGEVINWSELDGPFQGYVNHAEALHNAGYNAIPKAIEQ